MLIMVVMEDMAVEAMVMEDIMVIEDIGITMGITMDMAMCTITDPVVIGWEDIGVMGFTITLIESATKIGDSKKSLYAA